MVCLSRCQLFVKGCYQYAVSITELCIKIHEILGSLSITNSLACELSASGDALHIRSPSPWDALVDTRFPRFHFETIDGIGDQYSSIGPIRRLVLLYTILGASRKSLCTHSTVIYRSEITLYSLEYLEYLDKYRGLRGEDGWLGYSVAIRCFSSRGHQKIGVIYETCRKTRWIRKICCFFYFFFFFFNYDNYDKFE